MEIINVNGVSYNAENVTTSLNSISFTISDTTIDTLKETFSSATSLTVSDSEGTVYGTYENVSFESVTEYSDGTVMVTMHILTTTEIAIKQLQASQAEQDEAIAELYGMEV